MIELKVKGIRGVGIEEDITELHAGKVTKVVGPNCSGKTSKAMALAALLSRSTDPLSYGVQLSKRYINEDVDADEAYAALCKYEGSDLKWKIQWNVGRGNFEEFGVPPEPIPSIIANPILVTPEMLKKEFIDAMFLGSIEKFELIERLSQIFSEETEVATAGALADQILGSRNGWNDVFNICKERALTFKQTWDTTVAKDGQKVFYGEKVGRNWRPTKWTPEMESATPESIERKLFDANTALEHAQDVLRDMKNRKDLEAEMESKATQVRRLRSTIEEIEESILKLANAEDGGPDEKDVQEEVTSFALMKELEERLASYQEQIDSNMDREKVLYAHIETTGRNIDGYNEIQNSIEEAIVALDSAERSHKNYAEGKGRHIRCESCGQKLPDDKLDEKAKAREYEVKELQEKIATLRASLPFDDVRKYALEQEKKREEKTLDSLAGERAQLERERSNCQIGFHDARHKHIAAAARVEAASKRGEVRKDDIQKLMKRKQELAETMKGIGQLTWSENVPTDYDIEQANKAVDVKQAEIRELKHQLEMIEWVADAQAAHRMVRAWKRIQDFAGPDGIRREKIEAGTETLQGWLKYLQNGLDLRNLAEFKGGKLLIGGKAARTASGSEQWVASAVLRVGMTIMNGGGVVAIDGADILDSTLLPQAYEILDAVAKYADVAILVTETNNEN